MPTETRRGVLLAVPGTSCPRAEIAYRNIEHGVQRRCPGAGVRWAYTSTGVRKKLAAQDRAVPPPHEALTAMLQEGFTHVVVQPLHMTPGGEFEELQTEVRSLHDGPNTFKALTLGQPLLVSRSDMLSTARAILAETPVRREQHEAVVLVAHGSRRPAATATYERAASELEDIDGTPIFLGVLMGAPGLDVVLRQCHDAGIRKAWLVPFMVAAGYSAQDDIAGNGEGSWRQRFAAAGIETVPIVKGLGEYGDIVTLWAASVARMLAHAVHGPASPPLPSLAEDHAGASRSANRRPGG